MGAPAGAKKEDGTDPNPGVSGRGVPRAGGLNPGGFLEEAACVLRSSYGPGGGLCPRAEGAATLVATFRGEERGCGPRDTVLEKALGWGFPGPAGQRVQD